MKNIVSTFLLALLVVLTCLSIRRMVGGVPISAGQKPTLVAIGPEPVPLPMRTGVAIGPEPVPLPVRTGVAIGPEPVPLPMRTGVAIGPEPVPLPMRTQ
jgi:hypothetical protein